MDSRSGFAILLVLVGLAGMWLLVTGKIQILLDVVRAGAKADTGSAAPAGAAGSSSTAPPNWLDPYGTGTWGTMPSTPPFIGPPSSPLDPHQPTTTNATQAYGIRLGGDGLALDPFGGIRVLG